MVHERIVKEKEVVYLAELEALESELKELKKQSKEKSTSRKGVGARTFVVFLTQGTSECKVCFNFYAVA